jgi:hypothetical protein
VLADQPVALGRQIDRMEAAMGRRCRNDADGARLPAIPGIGPITAGAIPAGVPDIAGFRSGRDFAAWLGLVPRQSSSGGRERLGRITEMGDRTIRRPARDRRPVGHPVGPPEAGLRRALDRQARGQEAPEARRRGARRRDGADRLGGADAGRGLQGGGSGRASAAARRRAVVVHRR